MEGKGSMTRTIASVLERSPAEKAGLKIGDVITSVNGTGTSGLANDAIIALIKEKEEATLVVERDGNDLTVKMIKAPLFTFDRKCLTGNCVDGTGRAVFVGDEKQYEGTFIEGELTGACRIYLPNGSLVYDGMVKDRKAHGSGKRYAESTPDKAPVLLSEGIYVNNILSTGTFYNSAGDIESSGTYDADGWLSSGFFRGGSRYTSVYIFCANITYDAEGTRVLNGPITIRQKDPRNGRVETEANYLNGRPNGLVKEWDYNEDVRHEITYANGTPVAGTVYRISDGAIVGTDVHYKPGIPYNMNINEITGGTFMFGKQPKLIDLKDGKSAYISNIKELCRDNEPVVVQPLTMPVKKEQPVNEPAAYNPTPEHLAAFKRDVAVYNCKNAMQSIVNEVQICSDMRKDVKPNTYASKRYLFYNAREKIIAHINNTIATYEGKVPAGYIGELLGMRKQVVDGLTFPEE
jgi:antitoxin component YwqK of YwqJK toxin-antitoxin module